MGERIDKALSYVPGTRQSSQRHSDRLRASIARWEANLTPPEREEREKRIALQRGGSETQWNKTANGTWIGTNRNTGKSIRIPKYVLDAPLSTPTTKGITWK